MRKIRIGNDIVIRATVTRLGEAESFDGKTLELSLRSAYETVRLATVAVGNVLTAVWLGSEQRKTGTYKLTLVEDYGEGSRNTVDECEVFALVACSHQESGLTGRQTIDAAMDISAGASGVTRDVDLEISAPANGLSAYELAVRNGYAGTEAEWLESLSAAGNASTVLTFSGYVRGVALMAGSCTPDYVAFDTDRSSFVGAVRLDGGGVTYYAGFGTYGEFGQKDYGTPTDDGVAPGRQKVYLELEEDVLCYWDGQALRELNAALTDAEIDALTPTGVQIVTKGD